MILLHDLATRSRPHAKLVLTFLFCAGFYKNAGFIFGSCEVDGVLYSLKTDFIRAALMQGPRFSNKKVPCGYEMPRKA